MTPINAMSFPNPFAFKASTLTFKSNFMSFGSSPCEKEKKKEKVMRKFGGLKDDCFRGNLKSRRWKREKKEEKLTNG